MRSLTIALLVTLGAVAMGGCAAEPTPDPPQIDVSDAVVLDVRTPAEHAEGHLQGALNLDVQDEAGFTSGIAELDPEAAYVVYCRTGNRAAAAVEILEENGFMRLVNAGGLEEAAEATGLPVVTGDVTSGDVPSGDRTPG